MLVRELGVPAPGADRSCSAMLGILLCIPCMSRTRCRARRAAEQPPLVGGLLPRRGRHGRQRADAVAHGGRLRVPNVHGGRAHHPLRHPVQARPEGRPRGAAPSRPPPSCPAPSICDGCSVLQWPQEPGKGGEGRSQGGRPLGAACPLAAAHARANAKAQAGPHPYLRCSTGRQELNCMLERRMAASPVDGLIVYPEGALPAAPAPPPPLFQPHAMSQVEPEAERKRTGRTRRASLACARYRGESAAPPGAQAPAALGRPSRPARPRRLPAQRQRADRCMCALRQGRDGGGRAQATAASGATRCR